MRTAPQALTLTLTALALISARPAFAWPPTYGAEFTFTNGKLWAANLGKPGTTRTEANASARDSMANIVEELCEARKDCRVKAMADRHNIKIYRVIYDDGWWFQISLDPSVVEIQTKPTTYEGLERFKARIQDDIFGSAAKAGIHPDPGSGGGHIHIGGESAFEGDARLFRNFIVDLANHPELALGVLEDDLKNAPPLGGLSPAQQREFAAVIERFDRGDIKSIRALAREVQRKVYFMNPHGVVWPPEKYQAVNLVRMAEGWLSSAHTVELRAIRAQASADEYLKQVKLFQTRLEKLRELNALVPFMPTSELGAARKPQQLVDGFHAYVTETGLSWNDYQSMMPEYLRKLSPSAAIPARLPPPGAAAPVVKRGLLGCVGHRLGLLR